MSSPNISATVERILFYHNAFAGNEKVLGYCYNLLMAIKFE
jgi:hypothetical protein